MTAQIDDLFRFAVASGKRFLGQDSTDVTVPDNLSHDFELAIGGHGNVDDFDSLIAKQLLVRLIDGSNAVSLADLLGVSMSSRGDGHGIQPAGAIRDQLAIGHDETDI